MTRRRCPQVAAAVGHGALAAIDPTNAFYFDAREQRSTSLRSRRWPLRSPR